MKKIFQTKYLTALLFVLLLAVVYTFSLSPFLKGFRIAAENLLNKHTLDLSAVEQKYHDGFAGTDYFVTLNGGFQRLMGAREINDRYRLDNGQVTYIIGECDVDGIAENTVRFRDALQEMDIPMVYVNAPFKINESDKQLPVGVMDFSNENANRFLSRLDESGVPTLDLRQNIEEEGLDHYSLFYPTDHHWTAEAGFWATGQIVEYLAGLDDSFAVDNRIFDLSHYDKSIYEDIFLGSAGRRVGPLYTGFDDITLIRPRFDTALSFSVEKKNILRQGNFADAFLFMQRLTLKDMFNTNAYSVYCGTDYGLLKVRNFGGEQNLQPGCTQKKILLIKDSFSCVVIPFLSLAYEDVHVVDLRYLEDDLMEYIHSYQPDLVMVLYNPGAYGTNNLNMFDFMNQGKLKTR